MILSVLRRFRSLPVHHRIPIFVTILLPVIWPPIIAYLARDLVLQVVLHLTVFLIWSVIAVVAVSSALKKDRSDADELVAQHVEALSGRIGKLEEEHGELREDLWQEVDNLEEAVRSGFERLGVALPPRRISVRAKGIHFRLNTSVANVTVKRGSKIAHFRHWIRRSARRVWEVVYGVPDDS